ncbi:hypothetical protein B0T10DRAFT_584943 [Thelonectria olida]|uniref:Uncharacterized protein n=1 Tax=Thelonectria olida TaxID=1576542 RepID=A0A9P8VTL1_9HYPO|nr:hypothetical protein B0T10DRAFT_584943 [Thelonectria olida]
MAESFSVNTSPSSEYQIDQPMLVATNAPGYPSSEIEEDSPSRSGRPQGRPPRRVHRAFRELTAEEFQERRTKRRCWTLQSRVERMGRIGGIFSATIFLDATSRCWIGTMGVPTGQQIPNLNRIVDDYLNGVRTPKPPTELLHSGDRWTETVVRKRMRTITKLFEGLRSINQIAYILIADVPHKTNWTCMAHVPQGVASLGGLEDLLNEMSGGQQNVQAPF